MASKILKKVFFSLYILVLGAIGTNLFFSDQVTALFGRFDQTIKHSSATELAIGYALEPKSLEPTLFDPVTRSRLVDVYEGLVRTNRNLKIEPALALTWGLLDPLTWEFQLRPNVTFHDGKALTAEDVVTSIHHARDSQTSELTNLLGTIEEVVTIDPTKIQIKTKHPDPLLLNKLAITFIYPQDLKDFSKPIGTGPYMVDSWEKENQIILKRFVSYWGPQPTYPQVVLKTIADKDERIDALKKGKIKLLADVPPPIAKSLASESLHIKSIPSLEVSFLMFHLSDPFLKIKDVRTAISKALDRSILVDLVEGFGSPVNQFVSSGIFGFNPQISKPVFDLTAAQNLIARYVNDKEIAVILDYPEGYNLIGQYIQQQLYQLNIDLQLNPLPANELQKKIISGKSQMYSLGWRSELGDASDFLAANIHSTDGKGLYGQFNGSHYLNKKIDQQIESSQQNLNIKTRLKDLQEIMKTVVEEDKVGVPLIELQTIFAYHKSISFEPRVDGYLYASEINEAL